MFCFRFAVRTRCDQVQIPKKRTDSLDTPKQTDNLSSGSISTSDDSDSNRTNGNSSSIVMMAGLILRFSSFFIIYSLANENTSDVAIDLTKLPASTFSEEYTNGECTENEKIGLNTKCRKSE